MRIDTVSRRATMVAGILLSCAAMAAAYEAVTPCAGAAVEERAIHTAAAAEAKALVGWPGFHGPDHDGAVRGFQIKTGDVVVHGRLALAGGVHVCIEMAGFRLSLGTGGGAPPSRAAQARTE
jgi:hypothetical protein